MSDRTKRCVICQCELSENQSWFRTCDKCYAEGLEQTPEDRRTQAEIEEELDAIYNDANKTTKYLH